MLRGDHGAEHKQGHRQVELSERELFDEKLAIQEQHEPEEQLAPTVAAPAARQRTGARRPRSWPPSA